jgi:hypothetical protein
MRHHHSKGNSSVSVALIFFVPMMGVSIPGHDLSPEKIRVVLSKPHVVLSNTPVCL